jgi:alpha-beta hydrolase superfamily lysophospholipase
MLAHGYVVAGIDYPGLGTPEVHPYLVGKSDAREVLDSVRAAREIPGAGAGDSFAVWGHSQGGQAALFTGLEAAGYAPELKLVGAAAAAPATDLATLMTEDRGNRRRQQHLRDDHLVMVAGLRRHDDECRRAASQTGGRSSRTIVYRTMV